MVDITSSITEPAFHLTMFHPMFPGEHGLNIIRVHHARQHACQQDGRQLAISKSSRGLGLVASLEGQKINNMPNMASRKFSHIPKVICAA